MQGFEIADGDFFNDDFDQEETHHNSHVDNEQTDMTAKLHSAMAHGVDGDVSSDGEQLESADGAFDGDGEDGVMADDRSET